MYHVCAVSRRASFIPSSPTEDLCFTTADLCLPWFCVAPLLGLMTRHRVGILTLEQVHAQFSFLCTLLPHSYVPSCRHRRSSSLQLCSMSTATGPLSMSFASACGSSMETAASSCCWVSGAREGRWSRGEELHLVCLIPAWRRLQDWHVLGRALLPLLTAQSLELSRTGCVRGSVRGS